jgi:predicted aconitase with swiveling domain
MKQDGTEMSAMNTRVLIEGQAQGPLLKLSEDISLWGGVDPLSGMIIDTRHPQHGRRIAGKILAMHRSIGSSSGSSILLELMKHGRGPLGIILIEADFIITLGVLVAREMGFGDIPVVQIEESDFPLLPDNAGIGLDGTLTELL